MENSQPGHDFTALLWKIIPPIILATMAKIASQYSRGKRISFLSMLVITILAACGSILGYWISQYLHWTEYKMTLTIFFFGLFSDKLFEFLFSKTFLNNMFNLIQDWLVNGAKLFIGSFNRKKD